MTDARGLSTFRSWIQSLTVAQELGVLLGVVVFFVGMAADAAVNKIVWLALAALCFAAVVWSVRSRRSLNIIDDEEPTTATSGEAEPVPATGASDVLHEEDEDAPSAGRTAFVPRNTVAGESAPGPAFERSAEAPAPSYTFQISDFFEQDPEARTDDGPKAEFHYLIRKVLTVIKEVHFAHSVALFWVNGEKHQLVLENHVTESSVFTTHRRRELGLDLISQIAIAGKPQILSSVNARSLQEMLPYYTSPEPVRTFVGVPIFYTRTALPPKDPVAVLTVDCKGEDAYGPETLAQLGQFTKLISALIQSYTDKYDLLLDSEVLRSITRQRDQLRLDFTVHNAIRSLAEEVSRIVPWDYIAAVVFDDARKAWALHYVMNRMNDAYVPMGQEIDLHHSLTGQVIQYSVPKVVDNIASLSLPRYYRAERCESAGSLIALPLSSVQRCYGALIVESKDAGTYSDADARLLQKLADTTSWSLEILSLTDVATNFVATDEVTGVATRRHFLDRVQEEVQRSSDFGSELAVVMIAIDNVQELAARHGTDSVDAVLQTIGRLIKASVRPYDVVGRIDVNRFGILLVRTTTNEASLWSEKLRKNVASHIVNVDGKSFSVTISVGVSGAATEVTDMVLLENADRVLKKAVEAGGNIVRVF